MRNRIVKIMIVILMAAAVSLANFSPIVSSADSAAFIDINGHWAKNAILWAVDQHIVGGYPDHTFRPDRSVSEAEFLAMLVHAEPDTKAAAGRQRNSGKPWYSPYYTYAVQRQWPVSTARQNVNLNRGQAARLIASARGKQLSIDGAIQYLLSQGIAKGKTPGTAAGFGKNDLLTRAEAVQLIRNSVAAGPAPAPPAISASEPGSQSEFAIQGISIGTTLNKLVAALGQPVRKDTSEYGFAWYIYNKNYSKYIQVGVQNNKVVAIYTNTGGWKSRHGIAIGSARAEAEKQLGTPLTTILKGNVRYSYQDKGYDIFEIDGAYATVFYDLHNASKVTAVQLIEKNVELSLKGYYGTPSTALRDSYEKEVFDLANAIRVRMGGKALMWDSKIAVTARNHSKDMAVNNYFDHYDLQGKSPFDRMDQDGIRYIAAGENIAAGQQSAIFAHEAWMNSEGHRKNMLGHYKRLGVGVYLGGAAHNTYFTQEFYTPVD